MLKKRENTGLPFGFKFSERKSTREGSAEGRSQTVASPTNDSKTGDVVRTSTRTPRGARSVRQRGGRGSGRGASTRGNSLDSEVSEMANGVLKMEVSEPGTPKTLIPVVFSLSSSEDEETVEVVTTAVDRTLRDDMSETMQDQSDMHGSDKYDENTAEYFHQM